MMGCLRHFVSVLANTRVKTTLMPFLQVPLTSMKEGICFFFLAKLSVAQMEPGAGD